jgi:transcription elongation factor GreA
LTEKPDQDTIGRMDEKLYITKEQKADLEAELKELSSVKRKEIIEALDFAKSLGDLSENAEYHQAREAQGKNEARIKEIENILKYAEVSSGSRTGVIRVGSTVVVQKSGTKDKKEFKIVGPEEADMPSGKLSYKSPLGAALFEHKKGEEVSFSTPGGTTKYKIIDVK